MQRGSLGDCYVDTSYANNGRSLVLLGCIAESDSCHTLMSTREQRSLLTHLRRQTLSTFCLSVSPPKKQSFLMAYVCPNQWWGRVAKIQGINCKSSSLRVNPRSALGSGSWSVSVSRALLKWRGLPYLCECQPQFKTPCCVFCRALKYHQPHEKCGPEIQ